jgi:YHS domain-containing protein
MTGNDRFEEKNLVDQTKATLEKQQATDPVCGMSTDSPDSYISYEYQGETYQFCSEHCLKKFQDNPEQYGHDQAQESKDMSLPQP